MRQDGQHISSSKKIHVSDSKNHQDRFVPMPDIFWQMILAYYHGLPKKTKPDTWLFTQQYSTSKPMGKQWIQKIILEQRAALGINQQLTAHFFRHSHAPLLIEMKFDILEVSERLGHESVQTTWDTYSHLYPDKDQKLAGRLNELRQPKRT